MPELQTYKGYPLWHYVPSLPAAILFTILFSAITVLHLFLMVRRRMWFCLPFVVGGVFEITGYIGRILSYNATGQLTPYILQSIFLLLAPILFAASLYMTLSRIVTSVRGEPWSFIPPRWLTRIFVTGDVVSFMVQGGGAGLLTRGSQDPGSVQTGEDIIVGGLILQVVLFGVFILTSVVFHLRFRRHLREAASSSSTDGAGVAALQRLDHVPWQKLLVMLYVTSAMLLVRNIYRTIEYALGQNGYLLDNEWTTYVFDGVLMLATMVCFAVAYPSQLARAKQVPSNDDVEMR